MSKYIVDSETMTRIADAVRNMRHESQAMTPAEIEAKIKATRLGIPISVISDNTDNEKWIRPAVYPDLDALKAQIPDGSDVIYLTYDLRKTTEFRFLSVRCDQPSSVPKYYVDRGHVESGVFVVDETFEADRNNAFTKTLDLNDGEIQLYRVRSDAINHFIFVGMNNSNVWCGLQPCVECAGKLHHLTSMSQNGSTYTGTSLSGGATCWMERWAIACIGGNVTTLSSAFREGYSLKEICTTDWDTSQWTVTSMSQTFYGCWSLMHLDLSKWNTSNWSVRSLSQCWAACYSLRTLDISGWNTDNWEVTNLYSTWNSCYSLLYLDLSSFNTTNWNVQSLYNCWNECYSLIEIKGLNNLDTSNWHLTEISSSSGYGPFIACRSLRELDISNWDTSNFAITQAHTWFNGLYSCPTIKCPVDMHEQEASTNSSGMPNYFGLVNFNGYKIYSNHSYSAAVTLSHTSLVNILNNLPAITSAKTITLGGINKNKLTDVEIAVATEKGWTVA